MFSLSCAWIYQQVRWNEKFWVMSITIYQTSQNCTHVHPGQRRRAHRKILTEVLTKILILFIYIPSSLRQSTSISLYLKSKLQAASYSTLQAQKRERHLMTSMDMLLFPRHQAVSQYLCFVDQIVDSIFLYLIVSCCVLLQLNLTQVHGGPKARNTYRHVKRHSSFYPT